VPETKLRSTLISGCFVAYGIGCIVLNSTTLFLKSANWLAASATALVYLTILPSFFSFHETPKYLYNKGRLSELMENLYRIGKTNKKNIPRSRFYKSFMSEEEFEEFSMSGKALKIKSYPIESLKHQEKEISPFKELFSKPK
jgi:hypothetical protein